MNAKNITEYGKNLMYEAAKKAGLILTLDDESDGVIAGKISLPDGDFSIQHFSRNDATYRKIAKAFVKKEVYSDTPSVSSPEGIQFWSAMRVFIKELCSSFNIQAYHVEPRSLCSIVESLIATEILPC